MQNWDLIEKSLHIQTNNNKNLAYSCFPMLKDFCIWSQCKMLQTLQMGLKKTTMFLSLRQNTSNIYEFSQTLWFETTFS